MNVLLNLIEQDFTPIKLVKYLIRIDGNVESTDDMGNTPLILCAKKDKYEILKLLLEAGANVHHIERSSYKDTALTWAVFRGTIRCSLRLIKYGANTDYCTKVHGNSILHWAYKEGCYELFLILVHRGMNLRLIDNRGYDIYQECSWSYPYNLILLKYRKIKTDILHKVFLTLRTEPYLEDYILDFL